MRCRRAGYGKQLTVAGSMMTAAPSCTASTCVDKPKMNVCRDVGPPIESIEIMMCGTPSNFVPGVGGVSVRRHVVPGRVRPDS